MNLKISFPERLRINFLGNRIPFVYLIFFMCYHSSFEVNGQSNCGTEDLENPSPCVTEDYSSQNFDVRLYFVLIRKDDGSGDIQENLIDSLMTELEETYNLCGISFNRMCHFYIDSTSWYNNGCLLSTKYNKSLDQFITDDGITVFVQKNVCGTTGGQAGTPQANRLWIGYDGGVAKHISHEVGHCLNLLHTEYKEKGIDCLNDSVGCKTKGDFVCDTPPDFPNINAEFSCQWNSAYCHQNYYCYDSCDIELDPMINNIMTAKYNLCRAIFTDGQCNRMKRSIMEQTNGLFDVAIADLEIDHDTTFSVPTFAAADLIIKSGVTLTVTSILSIARTKKIIVELGASLKVLGGVLTSNNIKNLCAGSSAGDPNFWYGVELQTANGQASPSFIINNGKVEYSQFGIHLKANVTAGNYIIRIDSSVFKNNKHSVYLLRKPTGGSYPVTINQSRFYLSLVNTQNERRFPLGNYFSQIYADNATIKISKCTFDNPSSLISNDSFPYAIFVFNTNLIVSGDSIQNTLIKDVQYGVSVSGMLSSKNFSSVWCRYENNLIGIRVSGGINNYVVRHNTFFKCKSRGLWSDQSSGYKISQNTFNNGTDNSLNYIGVLMENSGIVDNLIDNNEFSFRQGIGSQTTGNNGQEKYGLQYRCNNHVQNGVDYYLKGSVNGNQGEPGNAAGNIADGGIKFNTNDLNHNITYFHRNLAEETPTFNNKVDPIVASNLICSFGSGGGGPVVFFPQWKVRDDSLTSKKNQLVSLIDQNETDDLIDLIQNADSVNVGTVYNFLLGISPWLSQEVVFESYSRVGFFTNNQKYQLLLENPDNFKIPEFAGSLRYQEYSIPDSLIDALDSLSLYSTDRTLLEAEVSQAASDAAVFCFEAIAHYKNPDSLDTDSLAVWLQRAGDYRSLKELVDLSIENSDFGSALENLGLLSTSLEGEEDVISCESLIGILENIYDDDRYEGQLDSTEQIAFLELSNSGNTITAREAQAVLNFYYYGQNEVEALSYAGDTGGAANHSADVNAIQSINRDLSVKIYPNPSNGAFIIEFNKDTNSDELFNIYAELLDITGRRIWKGNFHDTINLVVIEDLETGFYFIRLNYDNYKIQTSKVFIQR